MEPTTQVTVAQVVAQVVAQSATLTAITGVIIFGVVEALKKIPNFPGWVGGLLGAPIGLLVAFLINGAHFTPVGILSGILAGLAAPGAYSIASGAKDYFTAPKPQS